MSIVTVPNARHSRPLDLAEPNWGSSLLVGIQRLILFDSPRPQDLIRGTQLTLVGSNVTHAATQVGAGIANTNENSYWTIPSFASDVTARMSMLWVGLHSGGSGPMTIRDNSSGGGTLFFFRNANQWDMRIAGTEYTQAGSFLTGRAYSAVVTSSTAGAKTFVDGSLVINGAAAPSAGVTSPWYINQNGPNGTGPLATTVMLAIWERALTDQEAVDLSLNPWQLFADRVVVVAKTSSASDGTAAGSNLAATSSLIAGTASGQANATASGTTLQGSAGFVAGSASGQVQATASGQTLNATASMIAGTATGQINAAAGGQTLTATASLIAGSASAANSGTAAGATLTATASLIAGSATGQINASASGQTVSATASLIAGAASGANAGTAAGVTLSATSILIPGAASGQVNSTAAGASLSAGVTLIAGSASAANDGTASGVVIQASASFIAGAASGVAGGTAAGATMTATITFIAGGAYGPTLASTPGFRAVGRKPMFTARIGSDGRTLPRRRAS